MKTTPRTLRANRALATDLALLATLTIDAQANAGEGALPRFSMLAYSGGKMRPNGFRQDVVVDLAGLQIPSQNRAVRREHQATDGVGHTDTIRIENNQLIASGVISRDTTAARDVLTSARNGFPWQASIGAAIHEQKQITAGQTITVNGQQLTGPFLLIKRATLGEISVVDSGADTNTAVRIAANRATESRSIAPLDGTPEEILARVETNMQRRDRINALVLEAASVPGADFNAIRELSVRANEEQWTPDQFELHLARESRPRLTIQARRPRNDSRAIEAALCMSAGCDEANMTKWYPADVLEAAHSNHRGMCLSELFHLTIAAAGMHARPGRMTESGIRTSFEADRALRASGAGFSTISLTGILSNVANKRLLESYKAIPTIAPVVCGARDMNDFKSAPSLRLTATGGFQKVGPTGELKHIGLSEDTYSNQVETRGAIVTLTREMIINDDLGAFLQLPQALGRMSALSVEEQFFTLLLLNTANFFHADNKNYQEGSATALSIAALTTAEQLFTDQVDDNGKPILIVPSFLLVPSSLKVTAQQLTTETRVVGSSTADKLLPANNPHAGKWQVQSSPYLNNASFTGYSAKAWYLFASPADVAAFEIAYLRGQRSPTIESGQTDFDTLGMKWRAFFDFGVAQQDPRGANKSKGEA